MKTTSFWLGVLCALFCFGQAQAYEALGGPTQLIRYDASKAYEGYTLFSFAKKTYLIDMLGNVVHTWNLPMPPGLHMKLMEDGSLLGAYRIDAKDVKNKALLIGGRGGGLIRLDWDSNVIWDVSLNTEKYLSHHDFVQMPNGNVLVNVWENVSYDEAVKAGRNPDQTLKDKGVVYDCLYEINPKGEIVWRWSSWDLRGGSNDPEKFDVNFITYVLPEYKNENQDWNHFNDVDYDPATDRIVVDSREFSEIYIIDHKTGKLLYRWGNPAASGQGKPPTYTTTGDQQIFSPHDTHFIPQGLPGAGNILIFDNGWGRPPITFSRVVEMNPETGEIVWSWKSKAETGFAAHHISGAQRLPNGNTHVNSGNWGHMFEVTKDGEVVWEYINPVTRGHGPQCWIDDEYFGVPSGWNNGVFRSHRYGPDFPGLKGKKLEPQGQIAGQCTDIHGSRIKLDGATQPGAKLWRENTVTTFIPATPTTAAPAAQEQETEGDDGPAMHAY
ncbi:MAG: aryl-sulfate sulfotransferase [Desulfopila sp.]